MWCGRSWGDVIDGEDHPTISVAIPVRARKKYADRLWWLESHWKASNGKGRGERSHLHGIILHPLLEVVGGVVVVKGPHKMPKLI